MDNEAVVIRGLLIVMLIDAVLLAVVAGAVLVCG